MYKVRPTLSGNGILEISSDRGARVKELVDHVSTYVGVFLQKPAKVYDTDRKGKRSLGDRDEFL